MDAQLRTHVAFHLTGRTGAADLDPVDMLALRPALLARYRDLASLRYDFPVVLSHGGDARSGVQSLSGVIDTALRAIADGEADERVANHALRLEREIRTIVASGDRGPLSVLWDAAALRLGASSDARLGDSLDRLRTGITVDGELVDCDAELPARLIRHAWTAVQEAKARRFQAHVSALLLKLSDVLQADFVRSDAGKAAGHLQASVGTTHGDDFDFDAMSWVLGQVTPAASLPEARKHRIKWLIQTLTSQRFYRPAGEAAATAPPYSFVFETCASALAAYRERAPQTATLSRAIAMAELETRGEYRDSHDVFFDEDATDVAPIGPQELALFPDYLVTLDAGALPPSEQTAVMQMLAAGLPMKVLLQTDDLLEERSMADGQLGAGAPSRQLAQMAIGLNDVYVLQSGASHLLQCLGRIADGLGYAGPALFSIFSGSTGVNDLPAYLVSAAAVESRAFPVFSFDPSAGPDWASRFSLDGNSQVGADWPVQPFSYEDESHQETIDDLAFTLVDFLACDPRYGRHFAKVPRRGWSGHLVPVTEALAQPERTGTVPSILMVDAANVLHKVLAGESMMREARRCRQMWRSLQELAGIHNSHVERRLARELQKPVDAAAPPAAATRRAAVPEAAAKPPAVPVQAASAAPSPDAPYIETPRCTTCNECTGVNSTMFAYNENKQAYIANPDAGTYAQLVAAAEGCQVSIIHPGKPRNPNEPGLDELLLRAAPFL